MLVIGLGGAAVSIVSGDLSLTISGMSLAALVGIVLNILIRSEEDEQLEILNNQTKYNQLKEEIKSEVLKELRNDKKEVVREKVKEIIQEKGKKKRAER